jgi:hypothetical protein
MVSGLGKNDQKVYVIPSKKLVIVRMGEAALDNSPVPVIFDTLLWNELNKYMCTNTVGLPTQISSNWNVTVWPNPASTHVELTFNSQKMSPQTINIYNQWGIQIKQVVSSGDQTDIDIQDLKAGVYHLEIKAGQTSKMVKLVKL